MLISLLLACSPAPSTPDFGFAKLPTARWSCEEGLGDHSHICRRSDDDGELIVQVLKHPADEFEAPEAPTWLVEQRDETVSWTTRNDDWNIVLFVTHKPGWEASKMEKLGREVFDAVDFPGLPPSATSAPRFEHRKK